MEVHQEQLVQLLLEWKWKFGKIWWSWIWICSSFRERWVVWSSRQGIVRSVWCWRSYRCRCFLIGSCSSCKSGLMGSSPHTITFLSFMSFKSTVGLKRGGVLQVVLAENSASNQPGHLGCWGWSWHRRYPSATPWSLLSSFEEGRPPPTCWIYQKGRESLKWTRHGSRSQICSLKIPLNYN